MQNFNESTTRHRFLTKDEELALGAKIQRYKAVKEEWERGELSFAQKRELFPIVTEGERAITTLVSANIGLVKSRARNYKNKFPSSADYEDLVQEGMAGLMTAVWKYDPAMGNKFSTVAHYWIVQAINRGVNKTARLVRLPENRINNLTHMMRLMATEEAQKLSGADLDAYIMRELSLSKSDLANIRDASATPASLNKVVGSDGEGGKELMDFVAVKHTQVSSEEEMLRSEMTQVLLREVLALEEVKAAVVLSLFNLTPDAPSPEEVRGRFELQPFRFKKVQAQAFAELREALSAKGYSLEDFVSVR